MSTTNNVYKWLHYLLGKLLKQKGLRAPTQSRRSSIASVDDVRAYDCLKELDVLLGIALHPLARKLNVKKRAPRSGDEPLTAHLGSAAAVIGLGKEYGWIL